MSSTPSDDDARDAMLPELITDATMNELLFEDATVMPWERLPHETSRQYAYFVEYRNLGPGRTVNAVVDKVGGQISSLRTLSSVNGWVRRAEAFDDHLERQERKLIERGKLEARRRQMNLGQILQKKALEGLMVLNPYTATPRDLALLADIGTKLERSARGEVESTKRLEITGQGGGAIEVAQQLSGPDKREYLAAIQNEIGKRLGQIEASPVIEGEIVEDEA